jgi:transposase
MVLHARDWFRIPEETKRVAYAAFPKGNVYMTMRDELDIRYKDSEFAELFPSNQGRCAESPGELALVMVMQYAEGLTDRQAAEAVRARIDWKYALGLHLEDTGFDFSILSDFRERVITGGAEQRLLQDMLEQFKKKGLLKARGCQRTDSTHVLAAIRTRNRLECVGETMRIVLNALAAAVPNWLLEQVTPDWFDRYGPRFEQYRLPKERKERQELGETIGTDGHYLLAAIYAADDLPWLREIPAVDVLRQIWIQQYYVQDNEIKWRAAGNLPPNKKLIFSPYDIEARSRTKRNHNWIGYAVHLTETCDPDTPNLITHVETTPATTGDVEMTDIIHQALAEKGLLPSEHFVDTAYVSAAHLVTSKQNHGFDLYGPAPPDSTWQAASETGFDILCFAIDWDAQTVTCPQGKRNRSWHEREERNKPVIQVRFSARDCTPCTSRSQCTRAKTGARVVTLKPKAQHKALQAARQRQKTPEFKERYNTRAGVEGTISQGTRSFNLRRSRYIGLDKTRLQHILSAAAMNLTRAVAWMMDVPKAQTRMSHFAALAHSA